MRTKRRRRARDPRPAPGSYSDVGPGRIAEILGLSLTGTYHLLQREHIYPVRSTRHRRGLFTFSYDEREVLALYARRAFDGLHPTPRRTL